MTLAHEKKVKKELSGTYFLYVGISMLSGAL